MSELRECPICGLSVAVIVWASEIADDEWDDGNTDTCAVCCDASKPNGPGGCGASGGYRESESEAIAAWNRRPHPAPKCEKCVDGTVTEFIVRNDKDLSYPCPTCTLPPVGHPAPVGVRVPDEIEAEPANTQHYADGWNDCRDETLLLNPQPGAVVDDDRIAYVISKLQAHGAKADKRMSGHRDGVPSHTAMLMSEAVELIRTLTNTDKGAV